MAVLHGLEDVRLGIVLAVQKVSERQEQGALLDFCFGGQGEVLASGSGAVLLGAQAPVLAVGVFGGQAAAQDLVDDRVRNPAGDAAGPLTFRLCRAFPAVGRTPPARATPACGICRDSAAGSRDRTASWFREAPGAMSGAAA
ncbi:hypothetical protein ACFQ9J_26235 [Streptomyces sp. NPDC056529]|uniref:hypothetical protein n=1 Tax=Streptomyces sp. NPDC056529 TaxID=3345855 RepID=UPI0036AD4C02